jgi:hypothetical protein
MFQCISHHIQGELTYSLLRTICFYKALEKSIFLSKEFVSSPWRWCEIRGLFEKYPTFGREKETGLLGALDT